MTQGGDNQARGQAGEAQDARYRRVAAEFAPAVERLARGYEADPDLRRDLVQDIHVALWRSFAYFTDACSERSWVYRIAHNVAVTHMIKRRRIKVETLVDLDELQTLTGGARPDEQAAAAADLHWLLAAVHRLKAADRQVLLLYLEGLTAAEIADVVGLSPGAVAVRIHRCKALLARRHQEVTQ